MPKAKIYLIKQHFRKVNCFILIHFALKKTILTRFEGALHAHWRASNLYSFFRSGILQQMIPIFVNPFEVLEGDGLEDDVPELRRILATDYSLPVVKFTQKEKMNWRFRYGGSKWENYLQMQIYLFGIFTFSSFSQCFYTIVGRSSGVVLKRSIIMDVVWCQWSYIGW